MLTFLAEQTPGFPEPSQLKDFLQYGQMGLALATLLVGAGLFAAALRQQNLNDTTAGVLKLFAKIMITLFVISFLGEMATKVMDFVDSHRPVVAFIELPPLNEKNYKDYGPIEIRTMELNATNQAPPVPADQARRFSVHNGTQFRIDLDSLISQVRQSQNIAASAITQAAGKSNTLGTGAAQ